MPEALERKPGTSPNKRITLDAEGNPELDEIIDARIDSKIYAFRATLTDLIPGFEKTYQEHLASLTTTESLV
jgi:hypothetical protein